MNLENPKKWMKNYGLSKNEFILTLFSFVLYGKKR